MKIVGINGSVFGHKTKTALEAMEFSSAVEFQIIDLSTTQLNFADGRDFREYNDTTRNVVQKILDADALLIGTPIFNASIPGALKNLLDLLPIDSIKDKTVGAIVTAGSDKHYLVAQYHLFPILEYMKAATIARYVFITDESYVKTELNDDDIYFRLKSLSRDIENSIISIRKEYEARYDF